MEFRVNIAVDFGIADIYLVDFFETDQINEKEINETWKMKDLYSKIHDLSDQLLGIE